MLLGTNVLQGLDYAVYDPVKDFKCNIWTFPQACFRCLNSNKKLFIKNLSFLQNLKRISRNIRAQLIANQLRKLKPKVILTFNDNSHLFHLVCKAYKEVPFLAIQNGGRHIWCATEAMPDTNAKYHIDEYFCFGPYVQELFERHGHDIKKYIICGSLIGGYFFSSQQLSANQKKPDHDVCLISQWGRYITSLEGVPDRWANLGEAKNVMVGFVARYAKEHQIKVCVALRTNDPNERMFYESHFGGRCVFQESNRSSFSSYKAIVASRLTIALNSTLATEAFGQGLKVLFLNPFGEEWLSPTNRVGPWCLSKPSYEAFSARVTYLLEMSMEDYLNEAREEMRNVMSYDLTRPAHVIIRDRLLEIVGNEKQPGALVD